MHYSFFNTPIALAVVAILTTVSLQPSAIAAELSGRSATGDSARGNWYRLRDDQATGQKPVQVQVSSRRVAAANEEQRHPLTDSTNRNVTPQAEVPATKTTEPSLPDDAASGARWINVSDADSNQIPATSPEANYNRPLWSVTDVPASVPREVTPIDARPTTQTQASETPAHEGWGQLTRKLPTTGGQPKGDSSHQVDGQVEDPNKRLISSDGQTSSRRRVPDYIALDSVVAPTAPLSARISMPSKSDPPALAAKTLAAKTLAAKMPAAKMPAVETQITITSTKKKIAEQKLAEQKMQQRDAMNSAKLHSVDASVVTPPLSTLNLSASGSTFENEVSTQRIGGLNPRLQEPQALPTLEQDPLPKRDVLLSRNSSANEVVPGPPEASRNLLSLKKSSPREPSEFGPTKSEKLSAVETTQVPSSQIALPFAGDVRDVGRTSTPAPTDMPSPKQPRLDAPQLLSLDKGSSTIADDHTMRSSQPVGLRYECIQLDAATLHHLRSNDPIDRLEVDDKKVCEIFRQTDREVGLIAKQNGETSVTIHYSTGRAPDVYTVRVGTLKKTPSQLASDMPLQRMIAEMFPDSNVLIARTDNHLVVTGTSHSDAEAVRLISFVRSLRLVPVVDQIKVQR